MDADHVGDKRAILLAAQTRRSMMDGITVTQPLVSVHIENHNQDSNRWQVLLTGKDNKQMNIKEYAAVHLGKPGISEDDIERSFTLQASLNDKTNFSTIQEYFSSYPERPALTSAWNSLTSGLSAQSGPPSTMDVLTLWQDDPEELLLDLGFGVLEPDITDKIPVRFINYQSKARGINVQVFLAAQQNRIDIENPDVRNRFRQIEVLQQVTTAFNSLVGGAIPDAQKPVESLLSEEAKVRRKRVGMLFKNASKKSLRQLAHFRDQQQLPVSSVVQVATLDPGGDLPLDKRILVKRANLSPLVEEQISVSEGAESMETTTLPQVKNNSPKGARELKNTTPVMASAKGGVAAESFELEEIQSFDEGSAVGSITGTPDHPGNERICFSRVRTISCQSDSSGFLEEPFVPAPPNPGPELMKVLNAMSGDSTESPQKSVDLLESSVHPVYIQDLDRSPKQTKLSAADTNINTAKGPGLSGMVISKGDITKERIQDASQSDCSVNKIVVQKGTVGDCMEESTTLQKDSPGLYAHGSNSVKSTILQKDLSGPSAHDTITVQSTTLQNNSPDLHYHSVNVGKNSVLQMNSPGPNDYPTSFGESIAFLKNSLNPSHDVHVGGDSQMEIQKSDVPVFKKDFSSTDPKADPRSNVPTSKEDYGGRSVSVQMYSSLVSQSSLRGINVNSSTGDVQHRSEGREHSDSDMFNMSDTAQCRNSSITKEHTLSNPWISQESFKGSYSVSFGKIRSYEEDTRWKAALWPGVQSCSCKHEQQGCCQTKNSEKQDSQSPVLHPASTLPYSIEELISMMRCMWKFRRMLTEIEERLEEEQETVNNSFSDEHREEMQDILKLRTAVKMETKMLEEQLSEMVQAYDDNIPLKMDRLLDEQTHLCTQLRFTPQPGHVAKKSVGIQCTLLSDSPELHLSTQLTDSKKLMHNTEWSPGGKADFARSIKSFFHIKSKKK